MNFRPLLWTLAVSGLFLARPLYAVPIKGSVTGPDKAPIVGATVLIITPDGPTETDRVRYPRQATVLIITPDGKSPVKVQTGADGQWAGDVADVTTLPEGMPANDAFADFVGAAGTWAGLRG